MVSESRIRPSPPAGAFWRFSLAFYQRPGVAAACLDLQERFGRDVNLLLYVCWVGLSGRGRLSVAELARTQAAIGPWRESIVEPLRAVRRLVKEETDTAELYAALKAVELQAERHVQDRLEALAPPAVDHPSATGLEDALANLATYLGRGVAWDAAAPIRSALTAELNDRN